MIDIEETAWAIAKIEGESGFIYFGTYPSRREAIATHIKKLYDLDDKPGPMSKEFRKKWIECKKNGDRVITVRMVALT